MNCAETKVSSIWKQNLLYEVQLLLQLNVFQGGKGDLPKCIDKSKLCDGVSDCEDGEDEKDACCKYPRTMMKQNSTILYK